MEKGLTIRTATSGDTVGISHLWNEACNGDSQFVYKTLTPADVVRTFSPALPDTAVINVVACEKDTIVGFANGVTGLHDIRGFITTIIVNDGLRRQGIGTALLGEIEHRIVDVARGTECFELMFFNPIHLEWLVPGTPGHDHPNAPGVDVASEAYLFLKNNGYRDTAYLNSYYLPLREYAFPEEVQRRIEDLGQQGITATRFDPEKHRGLESLFDNLANDEWRQIVLANVDRKGVGDPVLVAHHDGNVCGFTGPISVQPSGRGYFAGIGVHSDYRGKGAGTVLFATLCLELKKMGAGFMTLFTGETNPARNIYESAGFKIVKTWATTRKVR